MIYPITRTETGKPAIGIGGGAFTKKFQFRTVIKFDRDHYSLKPAEFIKTAGDRASRMDQGLTLIEPGDLIVYGSGFLPVNKENPEITIESFRVYEIKEDYAIGVKETVTLEDLPISVITGAGIYHNRDGEFFAGSK